MAGWEQKTGGSHFVRTEDGWSTTTRFVEGEFLPAATLLESVDVFMKCKKSPDWKA